MWEPRRLTTLLASTACYRDSFFYGWAVRPTYVCFSETIIPTGHDAPTRGTTLSSLLILSYYGFAFSNKKSVGISVCIFLLSSRPALEPTQPPIQRVPVALSPGIKRSGREADHAPPTSAEVKKTWIYKTTPPYAFMA
jgi:hypothetical protein